MMLTCKYGTLESRLLQLTYPLVSIQVSWIEDCRGLRSIAPLPACISIHTIMQESCQLLSLPVELTSRRNNICSFLNNVCGRIRWINNNKIMLLSMRYREQGRHTKQARTCYRSPQNFRVGFILHTKR